MWRHRLLTCIRTGCERRKGCVEVNRILGRLAQCGPGYMQLDRIDKNEIDLVYLHNQKIGPGAVLMKITGVRTLCCAVRFVPRSVCMKFQLICTIRANVPVKKYRTGTAATNAADHRTLSASLACHQLYIIRYHSILNATLTLTLTLCNQLMTTTY